MKADPQDSIFLVTSSDPNNQQFGTAFAFYSDENANEQNAATFFLTCRHVVTNVGGPEQVRIGGYPATVVASGSEGGLDDLAVLRLDDLGGLSTLRLNSSAETGSQIKIFGYRLFSQSFLVRALRGHLGERVGLESRRESGRVLAWDLTIEDEYNLEQGYSGGPVIDERSGDVVAIANYRLGGRKGVALSIDTFERVGSPIIGEIGTKYVNWFWRNLIEEQLERQPLNMFGTLARIDARKLRQLQVSTRVGFSIVGTSYVNRPQRGSLGLYEKGYLPAYPNRYFTYIGAMIEADALTEEDIDTLLRKLCANTNPLEPVSDNQGGEGLLYSMLNVSFLFLQGCPQELLRFIAGQVEATSEYMRNALESRTLPFTLSSEFFAPTDISVKFMVFDLRERQVHIAPEANTSTSEIEAFQAFVERLGQKYLF